LLKEIKAILHFQGGFCFWIRFGQVLLIGFKNFVILDFFYIFAKQTLNKKDV